ncbi:hypothetical protein TSL6_05780 [Sulfurovum sp. TSL6]|uniref:hypothetical protein n=1 Tax=Sulfurovum sp. TSL6 TaxID=2826995 RepID=UPI001CC72371|nr:hypothetical protein [Sulfurovum sp. TSL6]GIU00072.1 hypothetical protein TSL6_05780 [Sulfurovum sp. TSL6]
MITCDKEISQWLEKMEKGIPICSLRSIHEYIEYAKKKNLAADYFPVLDCGFIVYKDKTIFLTAEDGGTILSLNPMTA